MPDKHEVGGSSPLGPTTYGGVAQLGEHLPCKQGVMGSNPIISTKEKMRSIAKNKTEVGFEAERC